MKDFEGAKAKRDERLRRLILRVLELALRTSPRGGASGRMIRDQIDSMVTGDQQTEDDQHAMGLLRDLVAMGDAAEEILPRRGGQMFGPDFVFLKITDQGLKRLRQKIAPDPDVADEREWE